MTLDFWTSEEWENWSNELSELIDEDDDGRYSNPEGAQEQIILDCFRAYIKRMHDAEEVARVVVAENLALRRQFGIMPT